MPHLRQLIHVGYKIAAQLGDRYLRMLDACESIDRQERDGESLRSAFAAAILGRLNQPIRRSPFRIPLALLHRSF